MWKIFKYKSKELGILKEDLKKKFDKNYQIYVPTIFLKRKIKTNKLLEKRINIMGDYLFCYHKSFSDKNFNFALNSLRGLKSVLPGAEETQKDIKSFIERCKNKEDVNGYLCQSFFDVDLKKTYKFLSGPLNNVLFKILETQKNKLNILVGDIKINFKSKNLNFQPV